MFLYARRIAFKRSSDLVLCLQADKTSIFLLLLKNPFEMDHMSWKKRKLSQHLHPTRRIVERLLKVNGEKRGIKYVKVSSRNKNGIII